ncbi:MAG: glycosyltransferase family 4 protein [Deltaproteobacteria bacterium]|nr:glycosyltransferase family 4 protein [Deltaproteobacteria bacterium]
MNILFSSHAFYPNIGGLETVSLILAHEFVRQGHKVTLITPTQSREADNFPFQVIRRPKARQLMCLVKRCDVYFQNNVSLRTAWPLLFICKPWVVAHHIWIPRDNGFRELKGRLKHFLLRYAICISISQAIADHITTPSAVIPDSYDDDVFYEMPGQSRGRELVFVGRLISDKGADLVIEAVARLKSQGSDLHLTVVGAGPEETALYRLVRELGVYDQVDFVGVKRENELAALLNAHQVMVVPSLWEEPFGVVALEGIACGCVVVGSEGGGLKDAIGHCGVTFPNGDVQAMMQRLTDLFSHPDRLLPYRAAAKDHLSRHSKAAVASAYLQVLKAAYEEHKS